jgi:D-amino-acid dehydrogenase
MKRVGIIGGGIIGLSSAYYLRKAGFSVTIFDQGNLEDGCSFGNAGMIVPSHFIPLAAPGMVAKGIKWMFDSESPFFVRPRLSRDLISWGLKFYRHANRQHVERSMPALSALSLYSKSLYQQMAAELPFDFGYKERGLLMLYQGTDIEREEHETVHLAERLGISAQVLTLSEIQKLEPDVKVSARGGVYYPGDAHLIPGLLVRNLINLLRQQGVVIETGCRVEGLVTESSSVKAIRTSRGEYEADEWVLAAGSWSAGVASLLGIQLPMQAGKGYSFTLNDVAKNTRIPTIFLEARVAVTPMGSALRFGGTMEITGIDHSVNMNRVKGIVSSIRNYYPEMNVALPEKKDVWHGLRPCSPDGMPYIGRTNRQRNVVVATGHSMMGLSLGPGTGKLVSELLSGENASIDLTMFSPDRFDKRA